jgi:hypothetical protein
VLQEIRVRMKHEVTGHTRRFRAIADVDREWTGGRLEREGDVTTGAAGRGEERLTARDRGLIAEIPRGARAWS